MIFVTLDQFNLTYALISFSLKHFRLLSYRRDVIAIMSTVRIFSTFHTLFFAFTFASWLMILIKAYLTIAALKKDNVEMKSYIDKLVAKCMIHCPEALAQDDDERAKLFLL